MTTSELVGRYFPTAKRSSQGWTALCPGHEDQKESLSIAEGQGGAVLLHCHAGCQTEAVLGALGLQTKDLYSEPKVRAPLSTRPTSKPLRPFDWRPCVEAVTEEKVQELATWRGYSPEFAKHLVSEGLIGLVEDRWAIPVYGAGRVVGAHVRMERGWRFTPTGLKVTPLVIGDPATATNVWLFESQWDAFAAMEAAYWSERLADQAVLITRGAGNAQLTAGLVSKNATVFAFPQNDTLKDDGSSPALKWLAGITKQVGCPVRRVITPEQFKDVNDWLREGAGGPEFWAAIEDATTDGPCARSLGELKRRVVDDPTELLKHGYLCRGGGLLLVGPTGIGKSSFSMQCMLLWSLGLPSFDIQPTRQLKSLVVQAENDDGDLAEMRDGVFAGLRLSDEERRIAEGNILIFNEDQRTGSAFCQQVLRPLLQQHRPDMVWIDPALSFLGGDAASQKDVGSFLRNHLNPLLHEYECSAVVIHHTNKPASGKERPEWSGSDFAYLGSGSIEWANWARAVLVVRSLGSHEVFELRAGKRGRRLGWREPDGQTKAYAKHIAHDTDPSVICWHEILKETVSQSAQMPTAKNEQDLLALVPTTGTVPKAQLIQRASSKGIGNKKAAAFIEQLLSAGLLFEHRIARQGARPFVHLSRVASQAHGAVTE